MKEGNGRRNGESGSPDHAETPTSPFVFSSNGNGFVHDRTGNVHHRNSADAADFPSPAELWQRLLALERVVMVATVETPYCRRRRHGFRRYYQITAKVTVAIEAVQVRVTVSMVMATGTGKTYTAFPDHLAAVEVGRSRNASLSG